MQQLPPELSANRYSDLLDHPERLAFHYTEPVRTPLRLSRSLTPVTSASVLLHKARPAAGPPFTVCLKRTHRQVTLVRRGGQPDARESHALATVNVTGAKTLAFHADTPHHARGSAPDTGSDLHRALEPTASLISAATVHEWIDAFTTQVLVLADDHNLPTPSMATRARHRPSDVLSGTIYPLFGQLLDVDVLGPVEMPAQLDRAFRFSPTVRTLAHHLYGPSRTTRRVVRELAAAMRRGSTQRYEHQALRIGFLQANVLELTHLFAHRFEPDHIADILAASAQLPGTAPEVHALTPYLEAFRPMLGDRPVPRLRNLLMRLSSRGMQIARDVEALSHTWRVAGRPPVGRWSDDPEVLKARLNDLAYPHPTVQPSLDVPVADSWPRQVMALNGRRDVTGRYELVAPERSSDLLVWNASMDMCLPSYVSMVGLGDRYIFGIEDLPRHRLIAVADIGYDPTAGRLWIRELRGRRNHERPEIRRAIEDMIAGLKSRETYGL